MKTADFLVERLKAWGVKRIFGYSGDGINGVIGALQRDGEIDFIQPRHEEMGAFMAVGYAKFSGELRRLPRDRRPRCDPPYNRPVRRQVRSHAPARHMRTSRGDSSWGQLPAGAEPRPHVRRRRRICSGSEQAGPAAARGRPRYPPCDCPPWTFGDHPSQGRPGRKIRGAGESAMASLGRDPDIRGQRWFLPRRTCASRRRR